ncbi:MAG: alpha/beta hydrolase [Alistipes sp.]|nr:alpha/beta hydrolase [Candidatus Alistipes equi]
MRRLLSLLVILLLFVQTIRALEKRTYAYVQRDSLTLYMDHYISSITKEQRPAILFVFGGGFASGRRDSANYIPYFRFLVKNGYDVFSIDYRLGMKDVGKRSIFSYISLYNRTINNAAEDLLSAAAYIIENSQELGIDSKRIFASGSSAGAITCLQAEHRLINRKAITSLPENFNFKGIISFAGAIFSLHGRPGWKSEPCPVMFFHGDADSNVPYRKAAILGIGMFGPEILIKKWQRTGASVYFHTGKYRTHKLATEPMTKNQPEILNFLTMVDKDFKFNIHNVIWDPAYEKCNTRFSLRDFLSHDYSQTDDR